MVRARSPDPMAEDPVEAEALDWLVRLRDDHRADDLERRFEAWLEADPAHRAAYAEAGRLFDSLDEISPPAPMIRPDRRSPRHNRTIAASVAATLIVGAALGFRVFNPSPDFSTGVGERRTVRLADGSTAVLDAASAIDVDISPAGRTITLRRGRAWFEVVHEQTRPFLVRVGPGAVRDIGTGFEVARSGASGSVEVSDGLVELLVDDGPALRLSEGEGARFARGRAVKRLALARVAAWRTGRLQFEDAPLVDVLRDLERYGTGKAIVLDDDLRAVRLTGAFDGGDPHAALASVLARAGASGRRVGPFLLVRAAKPSRPD